MQKFTQKKIALTVGSALMLMAGTASAVVAPAQRATNPALTTGIAGVVPGSNTNVLALLSSAGVANQSITIDVALTSGPAITLAGAGTTSGSAVVPVTSTAGLGVGMKVSATGLTTLTILSIDSATQFTATANASATIAGSLLIAAAPAVGGNAIAGTLLAANALSSAVIPAFVMGSVTATDNNVIVYTGTTATPVANLATSTATLGAVGTDVNGQSHLTITLAAPGAGKAYRLNAGVLEYSSDNTVLAPVWAPVKIDIKPSTTGAGAKYIWSELDGLAGYTVATAVVNANADVPMAAAGLTGLAVGNNMAPTPIVYTHAAAGADKIDGLTLDTLTPTTAVVAADLTLKVVAVAGSPLSASDITAKATIGAGATATKTDVILATAATAVPWTTGTGVVLAAATATAADIAAYNTTWFNTGVQGATSPLSLDGTATQAAYTQVFSTADGLALNLAVSGTAISPTVAGGVAAAFAAPASNAVVDGAQAVASTAVIDTIGQPAGTAKLSLTFSEPMSYINVTSDVAGFDAGDLREVTENVLVGTNSLAALNLNAGGTLALGAITNASGQSTLSITGVQVTDLVGTLNVLPGIALKEPNDPGYSATVPALDTTLAFGPDGVELGGGVTAVLGATFTLKAPIVTALATTTSATSIAFGGTDTTATAFTSDGVKVQTIVVNFAAGKEVALNATAPAKTLTDLAANLVITVNGIAGITPVQFQFHPTAAQLALNTAGSQLTITLPTALIYANIDLVQRMEVEYLAAGATGVAATSLLVGKADATITVAQAAIDVSLTVGTERVILPLSATATANTLITQSIVGTLTSATAVNGSRVMAYLAKWVDAPKASTAVESITSGKITNPGDKVATDLALEFADMGTNNIGGVAGTGTGLLGLLDDQMLAVAKATPAIPGVAEASKAVATASIPVYVKLIRSNDTAATGNSTGSQSYLNARAILATTPDVTIFSASGGNSDNLDPVYSVMLNPVTGAITGRLTGSIVIKNLAATSTAARGIVFIDAAGADSTVAVPLGAAIVGTGNSYNLLLGVDPLSADLSAIKSGGAFVLLVHEQPGATSPFTMLTSADPTAANFMPFAPSLVTGLGTRTTLATDMAKITKLPLAASTAWALYGLGNPATAAAPAGHVASFPRRFIGIDGSAAAPGTVVGQPVSFWTNDTAVKDLALTMVANKPYVATELANGNTLSTITSASFVSGANALAWSNDIAGVAGDHLDVLQSATAVTPKVGAGWSLVTVPASGTLNATTVDAVIGVGAQASSQFTWVTTDGASALPTLTAGEAVFVHSKAGGNL